MNCSRYYRSRLTSFQQKGYDKILEGLEERKTDIYIMPITADAFHKILFALDYDNPHLFYVDFTSVKLVYRGLMCSVRIVYFGSKPEQKLIEARLEEVKKTFLNNIVGKSSKDICRYLHDWLIQRITYGECDSYPHAKHNIIGALIYSKCVCEGYSKAFKYLADFVNLKSMVVVGNGYELDGTYGGHAWNIVRLDSQCYHIDVTYDSIFGADYCSRAYFLLSEKEILLDHTMVNDFEIPQCPENGKCLVTVRGTIELIGFLKKEALTNAKYSEVRLTKGFSRKELLDMLQRKLSRADLLWYNEISSVFYRDYAKTLVVRWK